MKQDGTGADHRISCHLGPLLEARSMTLVQLGELTGVTVANLSVLKNNRARAIRFTTLTAICAALECEPGAVLGLTDRAGQGAKAPARSPSAVSRGPDSDPTGRP